MYSTREGQSHIVTSFNPDGLSDNSAHVKVIELESCSAVSPIPILRRPTSTPYEVTYKSAYLGDNIHVDVTQTRIHPRRQNEEC